MTEMEKAQVKLNGSCTITNLSKTYNDITNVVPNDHTKRDKVGIKILEKIESLLEDM